MQKIKIINAINVHYLEIDKKMVWGFCNKIIILLQQCKQLRLYVFFYALRLFSDNVSSPIDLKVMSLEYSLHLSNISLSIVELS
jgi:hypothetical protein